MLTITDFEVCDEGIHFPDYYSGFGCSCARFNNACVGIGSNPMEALDDCLDSMAQGQIEADIDLDEFKKQILADFPDFTDDAKMERISAETNELSNEHETAWYHIGIRWNEPK